jgi:N-acetylglucosaminyldiphosphoundecaprenol N-acetyl-beta-D-mannosaminyltransferase
MQGNNELEVSSSINLNPGLNVLGYKVFNSSLDKAFYGDKTLINTMSPNSYGLACKDPLFKKALKNSDILVLDGIGIALGSILIHGKNIKKIAGQDCFDYFMSRANEQHWKVFFMGSSNDTLEKIKARAKREYPDVSTASYSPPFKQEFLQEENLAIINSINDFKPDILFIGLTAPKQEKWGYQHKELVNTKIISTIGNVFDWYAGNSSRPARIWVKLKLEWLVRIFLRPEIFWRNTGNQLKFCLDLFLHVTHIKRIKD